MSAIKPSVRVVTPFVIGLFPRLKRIVLDNELSSENDCVRFEVTFVFLLFITVPILII